MPWKKIFVSVPWDTVLENVNLKKVKTIPLAENIIIEASQLDLSAPRQEIQYFPPNPELYNSDLIWPREFVKLNGIRKIGGFAIVDVEICPFRYHLAAKKLELVESADITINYSQKGTPLEKPYTAMARKHEKKFTDRVMSMVINPETVIRHQALQNIQPAGV
jgi:hypothetical protein